MSTPTESLHVVTRVDASGNAGSVGADVATIDKNGMKAYAPYHVMQDSHVMHDKVMINANIAAASTTLTVHIVREGQWQIDGVTTYFQTGSTSGTLTVTRDTGTNAPGAGTAQLQSTISLAAASQQTVLAGTILATPTVAGPGDRFALVFAGTMTSLANGIVNLSLVRVG